MKEFGDMFLFM